MMMLKSTGYYKKKIFRWALEGMVKYRVDYYLDIFPRATFIELLNAGKFGHKVTQQDLEKFAEYMSHDGEHGWGPMTDELKQALENAPVAS